MAIEGHEFSPKDAAPNEEKAEMIFQRERCCFWIPRFGSIRSSAVEEGWWSRGINTLMKIREWSEIVAGPRWKTFIRRFNRSKSGGGGCRHGKFQYDPLSYALNFDDGEGQNGDLEEEEYGIRNFSLRYAAIPMSANSPMDLGKDASPIT